MAVYTTIDDPSEYFQTATWAGTGATQSITNDGNSDLQPDWVWTKPRGIAFNHSLMDSSRGVGSSGKVIVANSANAEFTINDYVTSLNSDGFSVGAGDAGFNASNDTYVSWQWKANGGTTSTNTNGTVNSTVQANTTAGFSIVQWASDGAPDTIGHGLSQAPDWIFMKSTVSGLHWFGYSRELGPGKQHLLALDYIQSNTSVLNNTDPSSTVFYTNHSDVSSGGMIAYCFHSVQGYSKFGSYTGNGSTNGPFIYTGFKPAMVLLRRSNTSSNWVIMDSKRNTFNEMETRLFPNLNNAETTDSTYGMDFLSNGFKLRDTVSQSNGSGSTYIYMAFAEQPFVTSTGAPATAR